MLVAVPGKCNFDFSDLILDKMLVPEHVQRSNPFNTQIISVLIRLGKGADRSMTMNPLICLGLVCPMARPIWSVLVLGPLVKKVFIMHRHLSPSTWSRCFMFLQCDEQ
jgi:hypothetical protein